MEKHERVRLLLVYGDDREGSGRGGRISHGAATLVGRWPGYITSAIWFVIFIISTALLLMLIAFLLLDKQESYSTPLGKSRNIPIKQEEASFKLNNDFCREMTSNTNRGLGIQHTLNKDQAKLDVFNTGNNVFYIRTLPLNKRSACAAESLLKNYIDKNIFILMFDKYKLNYENKLKEKYQNLLLTKVNGANYLKGTPFKWDKSDLNKSMIAAGLITIWQFGGTVLSDNLISFKKRKYLENTGGACTVDYELLSCLQQCAAFVYQFINAAVDYNEPDGAAPIIDKSLHRFCGQGVEDCDGARRARNICDEPVPEFNCDFIRMDLWLEKDMHWENMTKYCPITYRHSLNNKTLSTAENDATSNHTSTAPTKNVKIRFGTTTNLSFDSHHEITTNKQ